jgi:hypothetical protein
MRWRIIVPPHRRASKPSPQNIRDAAAMLPAKCSPGGQRDGPRLATGCSRCNGRLAQPKKIPPFNGRGQCDNALRKSRRRPDLRNVQGPTTQSSKLVCGDVAGSR